MASFTTKFVKSETVAEGKMAFYFEKPIDLTYTPGQHPTVRLLTPVETDDEGNDRTLSFITIPSEPVVGFATRMRDTAFKRNLKNMKPGTEVELKDPRGSMVLPTPANRPVVFIAGGIGITPFISMAKQAAESKYPQKVYLFYSNKTRDDAAFLNELNALAEQNENFIFVPTMTRLDENVTEWSGERGHFTADMIKKHVPDISNTIFYMAGPAGLVSAATEILTTLGVDPLFIKTEDFGEYK